MDLRELRVRSARVDAKVECATLGLPRLAWSREVSGAFLLSDQGAVAAGSIFWDEVVEWGVDMLVTTKAERVVLTRMRARGQET